jgi:hypothetical protein
MWIHKHKMRVGSPFYVFTVVRSFSTLDARKRCGRHKRGGADGTLLEFVATSVLETQKAATLLQDVYGKTLLSPAMILTRAQ